MSEGNALACPGCGGPLSRVVDSRPSVAEGVKVVRRRRVCDDCEARHTTYELPEATLDVIRREVAKRILTEVIERFI